jgi:3-phenylpropionate/cinnamic acid dioxygenase small subunit
MRGLADMSLSTQTPQTPQAREGYFDLDYYRSVIALFRTWRQITVVPEAQLPSDEQRRACERLLYAEARLIDSGRLADWLNLYSDDCAYWLPTDVELFDPICTVSWEFNDRRRLEERVERLATGRAYSQIPTTRTAHLYTNMEMMKQGDREMIVFCNFLIQTNRLGRIGQRAGWCGFLLRQTDDGWRIVIKRINLIDADLPQDNNSFTL